MKGFRCGSCNEQEDLDGRQDAHVQECASRKDQINNASYKGDENINKFKIVCLSTDRMQVNDLYHHRHNIRRKKVMMTLLIVTPVFIQKKVLENASHAARCSVLRRVALDYNTQTRKPTI